MPTYETSEDFLRDWRRLTPAQRQLFQTAVRKFVEDLKAKRPPRHGLGVKSFLGQEGVFEFRWAANGRALFTYGTSPHPGDVHIIWLRIWNARHLFPEPPGAGHARNGRPAHILASLEALAAMLSRIASERPAR